MLTRSERNFVESPEKFSKAQARVHRCRINKKLRTLASDLDAILQRNWEIGLDLGLLEEFFGSGAFQNAETTREKTSGPKRDKNSILDSAENW